MSRSTISTFKLFEMFPNEQTARQYLEDRLWPNGPVCPECKSGERITARKGGYYRCNACPPESVGHNFTVRTNTIFERSHIPLHKWVYAMYLLVTARKGSQVYNSPSDDHYDLYSDGEHKITCNECDHRFEVSTRVSYSFTRAQIYLSNPPSGGRVGESC